jgi:predicted NBD/HSP70 family sugar kinase
MALGAPVDVLDGIVHETARLNRWVGRKPAEELAMRLGLPVDIGNDATLAGLGEATVGAAPGSHDVVYLKLSAAIGCGIVLAGRPYHGAAGTAGELAHMTVVPGGARCFCGNRGCLWTVIGSERILDELESTTSDSASRLRESRGLDPDERLNQVIELALVEHDLACQEQLREVGVNAGLALVNVCNLLNPSTIVVGGTLVQAGALLMEPLRDTVIRFTRHLSRRPPGQRQRSIEILEATLGDWAEVQGAAAMVLRSYNPSIVRNLIEMIDPVDSG